jgi:hypothetical protein
MTARGLRRPASTSTSSAPPPAFVALVACLAGAVLFFLVRPLVGGHGDYAPRHSTGSSYWFVIAALFVPYAFALRARKTNRGPSASTLLVVAAVLYTAMIPVAAQQSQDLFQNLVYGSMALHGVNPYTIPPSAFHDPWRAWTLWRATTTVYGPVWTMVNTVVAWASDGSLWAAFLLIKGVTCALVLGAARALALTVTDDGATGVDSADGAVGTDPGMTVLAFAYNPMVMFTIGLGAHADAAVAAAFAGAMLASRRGREGWATFLLVVAALVKIYAGLVLIAWLASLVRRRSPGTVVRHVTLAGAVTALAYLPFWAGAGTLGGLVRIGGDASTSLTGSFIRIASGATFSAVAAGTSEAGEAGRLIVIVLLALAVVAVLLPAARGDPWRSGALLLGAYALLAPWYLSWHLIGMVALVSVDPMGPLALATLTFSCSGLFVGFGSSATGLAAQTAVRYLPPVTVFAVSAMRGRRDGRRTLVGAVRDGHAPGGSRTIGIGPA